MMQKIDPKIEESWKRVLIDEFQKEYFSDLKQFLLQEKKEQSVVYPRGSLIFSAFDLTPFDAVKVVILGQDPYHGPNQAHGLCFSVMPPTKPPPSLVNIYKEMKTDLGLNAPNHGCLIPWARQGVLLLNTVLTVRARQAGSHRKKGWESFTDRVICTLSEQKEKIAFILWGRDAQSKESLIDKRHFIVKSPHPSPFAAHGGFFGSRPFSRINSFLESEGLGAIDWSLPAEWTEEI
jgi:uracil-DNA glycosylase